MVVVKGHAMAYSEFCELIQTLETWGFEELEKLVKDYGYDSVVAIAILEGDLWVYPDVLCYSQYDCN